MSHGSQRHAIAPPANSAARRMRSKDSPGTVADIASDARNSAFSNAVTGGAPLDARVRGEMEARFGANFADVRVHNDSQAHRDAGEAESKAFTLGNNIIFGTDRYAPHTAEGKRLLAHELAHVVQQRRGGQTPDDNSRPALEGDAAAAANAVASGATSVAVGGASAPGVMHDKDDKRKGRGKGGDDDGGRDKKAERDRARKETQQRKQQRAEAGKDEFDLREERANKKVKSLEKDAQKPGAKSRSQDTKNKKLRQYEEALQGASGKNIQKNKRKGNMDELQRTPSDAGGTAQEKYVAGGRQVPGQELRPGQDHFTQPDYSMYRAHADGTVERLHVNLKSNKIHIQTAAQARATARYNTEQAIRNSAHLPAGEGIIVSYAHTPSPEIQLEMLHQHFRTGSPIKEVRFGTTTHNRNTYEKLAAKLGSNNKGEGESKAKSKAKENGGAKSKQKAKGKGKAKKPAGKKSKSKKPGKKSPKAKPKAKAKPKSEAKPKAEAKPKESKARQTEPPVDTKAPEPKPEVKAPEAAKPAAPEAPKPAAPEGPKAATPEAPKVEGAPVRESAPKGGGGSKVGAVVEGAGALATVSALKGIKEDLASGNYVGALKDSTMLGLSYVPEVAPLMFSYGVIMNYWGPRHEAIQKDSFAVGDKVQGVVEDIPLIGDIPYVPKVAGALGAATVAVGESIAYTVEDMGEAVVDGAETLLDIGGDVIFSPILTDDLIRQIKEKQNLK